MASRNCNILRVLLYSLVGALLLYLFWPLLTGQKEPADSPESTPPTTRRRRIASPTTARATTTTEPTEYIAAALDGPIEFVVVLAAWKLTNCGNSSDPLRFHISHLEIEAGEHLVIGFDMEVDIELASPFQVNMTQWTQVSEDKWQLVPCGEIKGSCYLNDLCSTLTRTKCPALRGLIKPNLQCPVQPGKYSVPKHHFPIVVEDYLQPVATRYHFLHEGRHMACYDLLVMGESL